MEVKIICVHVTNITIAEGQINEMLEQGWELRGDPHVAPTDGNRGHVFIQTLVRERK